MYWGSAWTFYRIKICKCTKIKISNTFASERGSSYSNKTMPNHIDYLAEAFLILKLIDTILRTGNM